MDTYIGAETTDFMKTLSNPSQASSDYEGDDSDYIDFGDVQKTTTKPLEPEEDFSDLFEQEFPILENPQSSPVESLLLIAKTFIAKKQALELSGVKNETSQRVVTFLEHLLDLSKNEEFEKMVGQDSFNFIDDTSNFVMSDSIKETLMFLVAKEDNFLEQSQEIWSEILKILEPKKEVNKSESSESC